MTGITGKMLRSVPAIRRPEPMGLATRVGRLWFPAVCAAVALLVPATPAAAYQRPGATERISVATDGGQANDLSGWVAISGDGRHVAFQSLATTLVPADTNGVWDVFVRDRATGFTERVSVATGGAEGNGVSRHPAISADGRYVAFESEAPNLVADDTNDAQDVFLHDRETGITERVSIASDGSQGDESSYGPGISADGRFVAFGSAASNLVPGDAGGIEDVFVHDRATGTTELVSVATDGAQGDDGSFSPAISADGRFVAFESGASTLTPGDDNEARDVFVRDRQTSATERVSVPSDEVDREEYSIHPGGPFSSPGGISADGRFVVFSGQATSLVPGDTNGASDVFVRDRQTGTTRRVSVPSDGSEGRGGNWDPVISADGRWVAFTSSDGGLVPGGGLEVYLHDLRTGSTERVAVASNGAAGNNATFRAALDADGSVVAFESLSSNLVPGDTNATWDVFVRDRGRSVEVRDVSAFHHGDTLTVTGSVSLSGQEMISADDPTDDAVPGAVEAGAELTGVGITYRPEDDDILVTWHLASIPSNRRVCVGAAFCEDTGTGAPGVLYGLEFEDILSTQILATRAADDPRGDGSFGVSLCATLCTEVDGASGGIGVTGEEVRVAVPLLSLGLPSGGSPLGAVRAFTSLGPAATDSGASAPMGRLALDEIEVGDTTIPRDSVTLGIASAGTPESEVGLDTPATYHRGSFWGDLDTASLPPGEYEVWARACLGDLCRVASQPVSLE